MLLKIYKTNKPYLLLLIPFTGILLWINGIINCNPDYINSFGFQMPLYKLVSNFINFNCYFSIITGLILVIFQSFYLSKLNKDFIFIKQRTFLHAFIFLIILSSTNITQYSTPALFANMFILFGIDWLFSSYKKNNPNKELFNAGFLISTAGLFYFNAFIFFIPLILSYFILHTLKHKEILVIITGFFTPIFLTLGVLFLNNSLRFYIENIKNIILNSHYNFNFSTSEYIFYGYLLFLLIISFGKIFTIYGTKKISSRAYLWSFIIFFFTAFLSFIIFPFVNIEIITIAATPIAYIITDKFVNSRNSFFNEISFLILVLLLISAQFNLFDYFL